MRLAPIKDPVIITCRFNTTDLKKIGPTALLATEMVLNFWEQTALKSYNEWKTKEIRRYKEMYDECKAELEKRNLLGQFYLFRTAYFSALDNCETQYQMFGIYLEFQRFYMGILLEDNLEINK